MKVSDRDTSVGHARQLVKWDPVARALLYLPGNKPVMAAVVAGVIAAVGIGGGGLAISLTLGRTIHHFLPIYDPKELLTVVFIYLVVAPVIWAFYVADLLAVPQLAKALTDGGAIQVRTDEGGTAPGGAVGAYFRDALGLFNRARLLLGALTMTVIVIVLVTHAVRVPATEDPFRLGYGFSQTWWSANPAYFICVWSPITFINTYMLAWVLMRRVTMSGIINGSFEQFAVVPVVLHPDEANGLGGIGGHIMRILVLLGVAAAWISYIDLATLILVKVTNLKLDTILFTGAYLVAIPLVVAWPAWRTHGKMKTAKRELLLGVARELNIALLPNGLPNSVQVSGVFEAPGTASVSARDAVERADKVEALMRYYRALHDNIGTWPFPRSQLIRNILSSLAPLVPSMLTTIFQLASKWSPLPWSH